MLDYKQWIIGTSGAQGSFNVNGLSSENYIIEGYDHFGEKDAIWKAVPSGDGVADGGWYRYSLQYDASKAYRFIFLIRRTGTANGGTYTGIGANVPVLDLDGTPNVNPYFMNDSDPANEGWTIHTGYVFGSGYAGTVNRGKVRRVDNGALLFSNASFKSDPTATTINARSYLYYVTTDFENRQYWARPRMEPINGSEPPLATIYASLMKFTADFTEEIITGSDGSENILYVQTTMPAMVDGDYWIDYSTGENRVFWLNGTELLELPTQPKESDPTAPDGLSITSKDQGYASVSNSGKRLIRQVGPHKFAATISYPPQTLEQFRPVDAFLTKIRNSGDQFFLSLPTNKETGVTYARVNGAAQSGYSLILDGMVKTYNPVGIKAGQYLKIQGSDKIYTAAEDMVVDYLGTGTLELSQKLQFTPADNAEIFLINPELKVNLISVHKFAVQPPEIYSYEIDVEEVIE
jgi:hypothetical protein